MEFPQTNKKIKYTIVGQITIDAGEDSSGVNEVLEAMREIGEAEIVDVNIIEPDEDAE